MTAREIAKGYSEIFGIAEDEVLVLLDEFLSDIANTSYSLFADEEVVEFENDGMEDDFEEFLDEQLSKF